MFTPDPRQKPQSEHLSHFPGTRSRRPKPALGRKLVSLACTVLVGLYCVAPATAQLDLPRTKRGGDERTHLERRGGGFVVHLCCTRCETHNYRDAVLPAAAAGEQKAWCARCRWSTAHRRIDPGDDGSQGLDLPRQPRAGSPGAQAGGDPVAPGEEDDKPGPEAPQPAVSGATGFVLELLARVTQLTDEVVDEATNSLLSFGPPGHTAARSVLSSDHGPTLLVAARVLLRGGDATDADEVRALLLDPLPAGLGPLLLEELAERQPVLVDGPFLVALLDHPRARLRAAAQALLVGFLRAGDEGVRAGPVHGDLARLLADSLESRRADTRRRAVDLLAELQSPVALEALLGRLGDASASVAAAAVDALAGADYGGDSRDGARQAETTRDETAARLFSLAFDGRWLLRREAYALLALVEREDRLLEPILGAGQVEVLLAAAASRDPFVSGAAALALAGIGFRSAGGTPWLEREVPDLLVHTLSGTVFHNDFSALQAPAARRLAQITGQRHGTVGPAWVAWWLGAREGFQPRRAALAVAPEEEPLLELTYRDTGADPCLFTFRGPARAEPEGGKAPTLGELFRLSAGQCHALVALLRREGLLGAQRLPGLRGQTRRGMRVLELSFGHSLGTANGAAGAPGKSFTFGPQAGAPWFEAAVAALRDLEQRSRWQSFPPPALVGDQAAFWRLESPWWDEPRTPAQRAGRLKALIVSSLPGLPRARRGRGGELLAELYRRQELVAVADFQTFLYLLKEEPFLDGRARLWLALARRAAGLEGGELFASRFAEGGRPASGTGDAGPHDGQERLAPQSIALAGDLVDALELRFGGEAAPEIAALLAQCGPQRARAAARDRRPILRAVAATLLARAAREDPAASPEDAELLLAMLDDQVPGVEVAAVQAIGEQGLELGRTEVFLRARLGQGAVRNAALEAVGRLGGAAAVEVLIDGLNSAVAGTPTAAARGLVHLGDPATTPILVSMLGGTRHDVILDPIRSALLGLGEAAHDELRVALRRERPGEVPSNTCREAAMLLARQGMAAAAEPLLRVLEHDPTDSHAAAELAILSAVDFRDQADAAQAWRAWWGSAVHDDALAWLCAGAERVGFAAPPREALAEAGHRERRAAFFFLTDLLERGPGHLSERARRLLEQWLGRPVAVPRALNALRVRWFEDLRGEAP
ncbi:MAG TPA: hypothetical protein QF730_02785 [Planctomycetota bacterium]|nr:hypothetical protein [Planctomycetota bacterium]